MRIKLQPIKTSPIPPFDPDRVEYESSVRYLECTGEGGVAGTWRCNGCGATKMATCICGAGELEQDARRCKFCPDDDSTCYCYNFKPAMF